MISLHACHSNKHTPSHQLRVSDALALILPLTLLVALCFPTAALAHAADRGYILLLPTTLFILGGTLAVVLTVVLSVFIRKTAAIQRNTSDVNTEPLPAPTAAVVLRLFGAILVIALIASGFWGNPDPLSNTLPLTVWTIWWVMITAAHALFGRLWYWVDPFAGMASVVRRIGGLNPTTFYWELTPLPGYLLAAFGLLIFGWFELVSLQPEDPPTLATAVLVFALYSVAGNLLFGEHAWRRQGDSFAVFFDFIASLKPWQKTERAIKLVWPGTHVLTQPTPHWSASIVILVALSLVSFDGLNKTFWWLHVNGINPLAFAGRSSITGINSIGLVGFACLLISLFMLTQWLGWIISQKRTTLTQGIAVFGLSLIPISLAYHLAHYLTLALVNGQYWLKAVADPLSLGWNMTSFRDHTVTTSFLSHHHSVEIIWYTQTAVIVVGHCLAVIVSHHLALALYGRHKTAVLAQLPLTLLMVALTAFGLWLLSAPTGL